MPHDILFESYAASNLQMPCDSALKFTVYKCQTYLNGVKHEIKSSAQINSKFSAVFFKQMPKFTRFKL